MDADEAQLQLPIDEPALDEDVREGCGGEVFEGFKVCDCDFPKEAPDGR